MRKNKSLTCEVQHVGGHKGRPCLWLSSDDVGPLPYQNSYSMDCPEVLERYSLRSKHESYCLK